MVKHLNKLALAHLLEVFGLCVLRRRGHAHVLVRCILTVVRFSSFTGVYID